MQSSTFQPIAGPAPPWPTPDTTFSTASSTTKSSPFCPQTPQAPLQPSPTTTALSPVQTYSELAAAVKENYPDLSKAPQNVRAALAKSEGLTTKQIAAELHKATNIVRQTTDKLRELKRPQANHQESWHVHLKETIASWEAQILAYTGQQSAYVEMMHSKRQELQKARTDIQRLNQMIASNSAPAMTETVDLTEPDEIVIDDTANQELMNKM